MKLSDVTPGSQAATKKLKSQVQKASVAANREPRVNLGVVGISIGQQQSTGETSRITESQSHLALVHNIFTMAGDSDEFKGARMSEDRYLTTQGVIELALHTLVAYQSDKSVRRPMVNAVAEIKHVVDSMQNVKDTGTVPSVFASLMHLESVAKVFQAFEEATTLSADLNVFENLMSEAQDVASDLALIRRLAKDGRLEDSKLLNIAFAKLGIGIEA